VSATDVSAADRTGDTCDFGYCHLGGKAVKAKKAFGAGLVNAAKQLRAEQPGREPYGRRGGSESLS
jgi:hypothetical protein